MMTTTHSKPDFKILAEQYEIEIEGWHLFYESFIEYDNALIVANGILFTMLSEVLKAEIKSPTSDKIKLSKERVMNMFSVIEKLEGLSNRCNNLQIKLKRSVNKQLITEKENEELKAEILALKATFDE